MKTKIYFYLQSGAAIHTPDKSLKTPLMVAAECGYLSIMKLLVTAGARLDDRVSGVVVLILTLLV